MPPACSIGCQQDLCNSEYEYLFVDHPAPSEDSKPYTQKAAQSHLLRVYNNVASRAKASGVDVEVCTFTDTFLPDSEFIAGRPWKLSDLPVFEEDKFLSKWQIKRGQLGRVS